MTSVIDERRTVLDAFYSQHATPLQRLVGATATGTLDDVEDACQSAWTILARRPDIPLDEGGFAWLAKVATRLAWRHTTRARRELPAGAIVDETANERAMLEPDWNGGDPVERALERDQHEQCRAQLRALPERQRQMLALQAIGLSYREIAQLTGSSLRTVERQLLRGARKIRDGGGENPPPEPL